MLTVRALPAQFVKVANAICRTLPIPHCGGYLPHVIKKQNSVRILSRYPKIVEMSMLKISINY